tara:strand:- start:3246 stop:3818 length:573 start_codon:yes stop_codon:yes gene_type:complete
MASVYNYTFDNLSRLGDDVCYNTERQKQNTSYGSYNITNYFADNCGMESTMAFATSQPNVFYKGGYGNSGTGGCNIDSDSMLKIGSEQNKSKCRISLYTRPFLTVPYLGRGKRNPFEESRLQQGDYINNKKSCNALSEKSYIEYRHTPMIPELKTSITNPANLVEGVASEGWIRGGLPSRELIRDQNRKR